MKRCKPVSIGELWDDFKRRNPQVALKIAQGSVSRYWEEIVGPGVAAMTRSVELRGGVLHLCTQRQHRACAHEHGDHIQRRMHLHRPAAVEAVYPV